MSEGNLFAGLVGGLIGFILALFVYGTFLKQLFIRAFGVSPNDKEAREQIDQALETAFQTGDGAQLISALYAAICNNHETIISQKLLSLYRRAFNMP